MKESTQKLLVSLGSMLLIVASLAVFAGSISREISAIKELRSKRQATEELLVNYETAIQETNKIIAKYQNMEGMGETLNEVVPSKPDVPSFLNQIYGLAKLSDVSVESIGFQEMPLQVSEEGSLIRPYGSIQATVNCLSSYENMKTYLGAIETNKRLMNTKAVNIEDGFAEDPELSYIITVEAYYLSE
jgi:Tfp pilus assembly protein PilO